jgi:bacillithiol biosynthesis deacetylase BshB2
LVNRVLVVLPHPDDETFGCGGTIAKWTKSGAEVVYMCGTLGQMGRNMGKPFFATRESLPHVRAQELAEACKVLGIQDVRKMGLRDKTIEFEDPAKVAEQIQSVIREFRPQILLTHYPGYGVHPDHDALGFAAVLAVKGLDAAERPEIYAHAITHNRLQTLGAPDIEVDIADVVQTKIDAVKAHRSQSEGMMKRLADGSESDEAVRKRMEQNFKKEVFWYYNPDHLPDTLWLS